MGKFTAPNTKIKSIHCIRGKKKKLPELVFPFSVTILGNLVNVFCFQ